MMPKKALVSSTCVRLTTVPVPDTAALSKALGVHTAQHSIEHTHSQALSTDMLPAGSFHSILRHQQATQGPTEPHRSITKKLD